ncbi:MAG: RsmE family RNA methyltransferase [Pseudomonadota bacterium]
MRRIFVPPDRLCAGELLLDEDEARYVARVLRLGEDIEVELFDGQGRRARATLVQVDKKHVRCEAQPPVDDPAPAGPAVTSLVPLIKGERLDLCLRMLTELGVQAVQLVACERSVVASSDEGGRLERLQRVVKAAARQCGRGQVPRLDACVPLREAVARASGLCLFGDPAALPGQVVDSETVAGAQLWLCTGPEGGFTEDERAALRERQFRPLFLGPHVLRAETAAVAALAVVQQAACPH